MIANTSVICEQCGMDRNVLGDMLTEVLPEEITIEHVYGGIKRKVETQNHAMARLIISGCEQCREVFPVRG